MTYTELLTEIRRCNCDPLIGAGKFTKEELLADRLCAILKSQKEGRPRLIELSADTTEEDQPQSQSQSQSQSQPQPQPRYTR